MDYSKSTTEDFLADESFQDFVLHHENERNEFWAGFFKVHPEKKNEFLEAEQLIKHLKIIQKKPERMEMDFAEIKGLIEKAEKKSKNRLKRKIRSGTKKLLK